MDNRDKEILEAIAAMRGGLDRLSEILTRPGRPGPGDEDGWTPKSIPEEIAPNWAVPVAVVAHDTSIERDGLVDFSGFVDDALLTKDRLATTLGRCKATIDRMVARRELPTPARISGKSVWRVGDIRQHLTKIQQDAIMGRKRYERKVLRVLA